MPRDRKPGNTARLRAAATSTGPCASRPASPTLRSIHWHGAATCPRAPVSRRRRLALRGVDIAFDPPLDFFVDLTRIAAHRIDGRADDDADHTRLLEQSTPRPEI